jgi:hypothetical protein
VRATTVLTVVGSSVLFAMPALAETPPPASGGLGETYVGMRGGYALPLGNVRSSAAEGDVAMADLVSAAIPVWLDAEYAPIPQLVLGLSLIYAPALTAPAAADLASDELDAAAPRGCPDGESCSSFFIRPGGHIAYHPLPHAVVDPWIGAGVGYEWFRYTTTLGDTKNKVTYHGPELIHGQLGLDFRLTKSTWLGLFGAFEVGRYVGCGLKINTRAGSCNLVDRTQHEWATAGLRVRTHFWKIERASAIPNSP